MSLVGRGGMALAALAIASVLAACSQTEPGNASAESPSPATPDMTTPATPSGNSLPGEAPRVNKPLDPAPLVGQPCDALSAQDRADLGLAEGRTRDMATLDAKACSWKFTKESLNRADLAVITANPDGLSTIYRNKDNNAYFEPTEISGYPAAYTSIIDDRDSGTCELWVGVNDQTTLFIVASLENGDATTDPCPVAGQVAEAAIDTLGS